MADENVVAVQVTADVGSYVDAMKQAATATQASTETIKTTVAAAATQASAALDTLKTSATATGAQTTTALTQASAGAARASEAIAQSVKESAAAAEEGGASILSFGDKIRELGNEHRSEQRFGAFIARDLLAVVPAAGEAGHAIAEMVSGLAFGSGIAVAIGAVKLLVAAFKDEDGAVDKFSKDSAAALDALKAKVADMVATMSGEKASGALARNILKPLEDQRDIQKQLVDDAEKRVEDERSLYMAQASAGDADDAALAKEEKSLALAKSKLDILTAQLNASREQVGRVGGFDALNSLQGITEAGGKEGAERERIQREVDQKLAELHAQTLDGNEKLEAEYVGKIAAIDAQGNLTAVQAEAQKTATLLAYRKQLTDFAAAQQVLEAERLKQADEDLLKSAEKITEEIRAQMQARKRVEDQTLAETLRGLEKMEQAERTAAVERVRSSLGAAKQMGDAFGTSVAGIITGSESATKALASMASAGVKAFLDMEIQAIEADAIARAKAISTAATTVTANAASAASGAAASQAGIPIIGPGLAIAAMAAMEAAVLGLLSALPSAAGGMGTVPHDTLAFVHAEEQIMPADLARGQRVMQQAFADGSFGGGGGDVHLHVHTASVREFVAYLGQSEVQRGISQLVRTGRWAG